MNRPQGGDEVGREELGEGRELPVQDKETARAGGDALGQGTAHRPRSRVTKVEGQPAQEEGTRRYDQG